MPGFGRKTCKNRSGFTLIELMTVLSIIGVLVVIAMPEFQNFRKRAYDSAALSDITQFRNAVANEVNPSSFGGLETGPVQNAHWQEVKISKGVMMFHSSFSAGGGYLLWVVGCHLNGETGYSMITPYGSMSALGGWTVNQIYEGAGYRWFCP